MDRFEAAGIIDENHSLTIQVPAHLKPGPVKVVLQVVPIEDETDWSRMVAQVWARDWNDPREDLYTLADGVPVE